VCTPLPSKGAPSPGQPAQVGAAATGLLDLVELSASPAAINRLGVKSNRNNVSLTIVTSTTYKAKSSESKGFSGVSINGFVLSYFTFRIIELVVNLSLACFILISGRKSFLQGLRGKSDETARFGFKD